MCSSDLFPSHDTIKASNAAYQLQYRDASYDSANVKLRKHIQYNTAKAQQKLYEYGADLARKQSRTHYWESVSHGLGSIASGSGNVVGTYTRAFPPKPIPVRGFGR